MKNKIASRLLLTLLLTSMITLAFNIRPVRSDWTWTETIYIRADGSVEPDTAPISSVDNITYTLTDNIVGDVPADQSAVIVERDNVILDGAGYTLQATGATYSRGISLTGRSNITIKKVEVKSFYHGIWLTMSSHNVISGSNLANNNYCGIFLDWWGASNYNTFSGNNITNNGCGIHIEGGSSNSIYGNNIMANNRYGLYLYYPGGNSVSGNNITNNGSGIFLDESGGNSISGNNITNNGCGINLPLWATYNRIYGNTIANNGCGINIWGWSDYNSIYGNTITNNGKGIDIEISGDNSIYRNTITNNGKGIELFWTGDNSIYENNITNNGLGIYIWGYYTINIIIYHNNFVNNSEQASAIGIDEALVWDDGYPSGGNYWSDHTGEDANSDGIVDEPYIIFDNQRDSYPLVKPFSFHDIGITGIAPSATIVAQGSLLDINITVLNYGLYTETFNLTAYANATVISRTEVTLTSRNSATTAFAWDTTGVNVGNYIISAHVTPVPDEIDTDDNYLDCVVIVATPEYLMQKLVETIETWNLLEGTENSLTSKLEEAIQLLNKGNDNGAIHKLTDLINQVEALRSKGKLEDWQADYLIAEAQRIIDLI